MLFLDEDGKMDLSIFHHFSEFRAIQKEPIVDTFCAEM